MARMYSHLRRCRCRGRWARWSRYLEEGRGGGNLVLVPCWRCIRAAPG